MLIIGWVQIGLTGFYLLFNAGSSLIALLRNIFKALKMLCRRLCKGLKSEEVEVQEHTEEIERGVNKIKSL